MTETHDYAPAAGALVPTFTEPDLTPAPAPAPAAAVDSHSTSTPPPAAAAPAPEQPTGPVPMLEGSFAIYVTPDQAVVLAYRPKGAQEDKQLLVPSFIIGMAAQQTGHTPAELLQQLGATL